MAQNIVLDSMPTVTRQGAGRKPTIVPTHLPTLMEAKGKFVVLATEKQSTASNMVRVLKAATVEGGHIEAATRHSLPNGDVAAEGQAFVIASFVPKKRRARAAAPVAVEATVEA